MMWRCLQALTRRWEGGARTMAGVSGGQSLTFSWTLLVKKGKAVSAAVISHTQKAGGVAPQVVPPSAYMRLDA